LAEGLLPPEILSLNQRKAHLDKKLPTWLLTLLALIPLFLLAALLISLASNSAKNQKPAAEDEMVIYYFDQQKPEEDRTQKSELIESQESRLYQQRRREFSQVSQSTESQLQDLKTERDLSKMQKSSF
jgi:uncharacterized membrane-anchored protein YhcB (DUF1043 family)